MHSPSIEKLIKLFSKFPTVGPRTAARFVFYLLSQKPEEAEELLNSLSQLKKTVKTCPACFNSFEGEGSLCPICANQSRDKTLLCLVASEMDLEAIEKIKKYKGFYFILGGTVSRVRKNDLERLRVKELEERVKNPEIKEVILALNFNTEGEATALYLERILKPLGKKITRLGRGLPVGGELEYADEETLSSALEGRK
ncbi:MAG: recombination protein RecR [Candidatus Nealsonbacteria bacterium]|nr:recombination protein RecR [Candidatus Nealsonbacteria bacterium]